MIGFIPGTLAVSSGGNASGSDCGCMMYSQLGTFVDF